MRGIPSNAPFSWQMLKWIKNLSMTSNEEEALMQTLTWRVVGASVQGASHLEADLPCQDAHHYQSLSDGTLLLAVADGAGSAARSQEGSRCVVEQALATLAAELDTQPPADEVAWREVMTRAFAAAHTALNELAATAQVSPRLFATTLTVAVLTEAWLVVGQLGDGCVVAQTADGPLFTAIRPQRGEYANTTYFLGTPRVLDHVEFAVYTEPIQALALTTDGLLRLALTLPELEPYPRFFDPLFAFAAGLTDQATAETHLTAFLASERVSSRTEDDKTLVIAARVAAGSAAVSPLDLP